MIKLEDNDPLEKKNNFVSSFPSTSKCIPKTLWLGMVLGGAPNAFSDCVCIGSNTILGYVAIIALPETNIAPENG